MAAWEACSPEFRLLREGPNMNVEIGNGRDIDDIDDVDDDEDDSLDDDEDEVYADDEDDDNVGDISVEINVEELVAKLEATESDDVARRREIRRRLEELREQREAEKELDSTFNFNLDDDL